SRRAARKVGPPRFFESWRPAHSATTWPKTPFLRREILRGAMAEDVRLAEAGRTASPGAAASGRGGRSVQGLARYFGQLGSSGFGGPIALVGYMHRDLVEDRGWYTEDEYRQALAVGQMFPGPLAAQTGMWLGYLEAGWRGAVAVIVPFVL